jgi:beta-barrel assembly-enhancing protease
MNRLIAANCSFLLAFTLVVAPAQGFAKDKDETEKAEKEKKEKEKKLPKKKDPDEIGNRDVGKGVNFYSLEKEIALGKQVAQDIERQAKVIDDPVISEYVNRVGQNLVRNSDVKVPVTIKVLDAEEVNAMALPGGFFFVNSGLVLKAESEAELAGVMAHELAHIAARHGTRQATRGQVVNLASIPLIFMGGWTGYGIRQATSILVPIGFLKFSRSFEREADLLGLQYLYKAGYDPTAFVDFFEKIQSMEKKKPGTMAKVFSSHPMTDDRIEDSQKNIDEILESRPEYVVTTSEFQDVKARLAQLQNRRKIDDKDDNRPRLKKSPGGSTSPIEDKDTKAKKQEEEDERPTLKRRPN